MRATTSTVRICPCLPLRAPGRLVVLLLRTDRPAARARALVAARARTEAQPNWLAMA